MCQKGIKSESSTHYSRPPALTLVSCSCNSYQNNGILLMKRNNPWRFRLCKGKGTKRQLEAMSIFQCVLKTWACIKIYKPQPISAKVEIKSTVLALRIWSLDWGSALKMWRKEAIFGWDFLFALDATWCCLRTTLLLH